ncbi:hypothetical protein HFO56_03250 [Rhizobium laguerreae]|uniref:hypothetical protein n=1 Tax=Rhizobium laguerreae TaxID=1076926 RepID=UPI001C91A1E6|nr:hypothetical protein [Rhizobium laguerreae]MBY3151404.1 hypothetical protein [Rhizobium laguerreae]
MNYVQIATFRNLIAAGMMIVVGYCLQWVGMATITARMNSALQTATLAAYDWSAAQSAMVQMVYQVDIWYWSILSAVSMCWAVGGLFVVVGLYLFISVRAAALVTIVLIVGTFALSAPFTLTDAFWLNASGNPSPAAVKAIAADSSEGKDTTDETVFSGRQVPSDLWSASAASLPLGLIAYGLDRMAVIYNAIRLALIPVIVISISVALVGSLRRRRTI